MKYYIVDAFSSVPFGGNQAGVVLLEKGVDFPAEELMIKIAGELRYSETAFIQQNGDREFTTRYFTPCAEVDLCGHATIAAFTVLLKEKIIGEGSTYMNRTLAGNLEIYAGKEIMMQMATPQTIKKPIDIDKLYKIMGGKSHSVLSPKIISTGLPDIIMPVNSIEELNSLTPQMDKLANFSKEMEVVGVHAFAVANDGYTAHVRNFAPLYGIDEESATGTANGALTHYLHSEGFVNKGDTCVFIQGEAMGKQSLITTTLNTTGEIHVGGTGHITAKGELYTGN